jgi:DNA repair photolyase
MVSHPYFVRDITPIQLLNQSTDPFLPATKGHTLATAEELDRRGLHNHLLIITRYRITPGDCERLNALRNLRVTLLVTWSGINDQRIEPVSSDIAAESLSVAFANAERYRVILYWRPIVSGLNDSDEHVERARELSGHSHATVFTGLFYREEIRSFFLENGLPDLYRESARRKIMPRDLERHIIARFGMAGSPLFRKTSCAVCYSHNLPDYNGHVGIRELCDICPASQLERCLKAHHRPPSDDLEGAMAKLGVGAPQDVSDRRVLVGDVSDEDRYFLQHRYQYQVHAVSKPHYVQRHGRADIGWSVHDKD